MIEVSCGGHLLTHPLHRWRANVLTDKGRGEEGLFLGIGMGYG
jgi:hypothetical protein